MTPEVLSAEIIAVDSAPSFELKPLFEPVRLEHHPAAVYLASLSPGSRRCMTSALNLCARTLTSGRCDAWSLPWSEVRFSHAAALHSALAETYAPASVNQALAAFKGVLKAPRRRFLLSLGLARVDVEAEEEEVPDPACIPGILPYHLPRRAGHDVGAARAANRFEQFMAKKRTWGAVLSPLCFWKRRGSTRFWA